MQQVRLGAQATLPADAASAVLAGRAWRPDAQGPAVIAVRNGEAIDVSRVFPTVRDLCEEVDPARALAAAKGESLGTVEALLSNTPPDARDASRAWLLAPLDLQAVKAAGVTFAVSLLERVIEERARGNPSAAGAIRAEIEALVGSDLSRLKPGSPQAAKLKETLIAQGAWSQYLEVGIGPDAEVFTKCQPMAAVGCGADIGVLPESVWNNPEPEVVLVVNSSGAIVGALLGNDVNLRDIEGRSALLLPKAKDNTASCAVGPFVRLFDASFTLDDVRRMQLDLTVDGEGGYQLKGGSSMQAISRDPVDLVSQTIGADRQYPDGFALFLGTLFAPTQDRDKPGQGFTHKWGDIVTITAPQLGALVNRVRSTRDCAPWTFGAGHLMKNLSRRGLI